MAQKSIAQHISDIKGSLRLNNADSRLTDRHIYLMMFKTRELLLKQSNQWLLQNHDIFQVIPEVELEEVDTVEACGVQTDCKIKRSKNKLPKMLEDKRGPIIKVISSLDGFSELTYVTISDYLKKRKKSTFKYDTTLYFWIRNGYIYFPNVEWDSVLLEGYLEEDYISSCDEQQPCKNYQDNLFRIPGHLGESMTRMIEEKLKVYIQIPEDQKIDKNTNNKG